MNNDKALLMQKHNNVHKTLCGLMVSWIAAPIWMVLKLKELLEILKTDPQTLAIISFFLIIVYSSIVMLFYYKADEYEHLIKYHCAACENPD